MGRGRGGWRDDYSQWREREEEVREEKSGGGRKARWREKEKVGDGREENIDQNKFLPRAFVWPWFFRALRINITSVNALRKF
jgi:hypothetical protein